MYVRVYIYNNYYITYTYMKLHIHTLCILCILVQYNLHTYFFTYIMCVYTCVWFMCVHTPVVEYYIYTDVASHIHNIAPCRGRRFFGGALPVPAPLSC